MDMHGEVRAAMVLVCVCGLCTCAYVPKGIVQCLLYLGKVPSSNVLLLILGMIDLLVDMALSQKIMAFTIFTLNVIGTFVDGHDVTILRMRSLITRIARSISGTCSPVAV